MKNKIKEFISRHLFFRQHPDTTLRYLPIVALLKKMGWEKSSLLEIGSGSYGIAPYLKRPIVGVDTSFSEPEYPLLRQITGSALALPFPKNYFDVCVFSDVLEHLPVPARIKAISESLRVAKKAVIISGPFGKAAFQQDRRLAQYSSHPFFKEHLANGLPETQDLINQISAIAGVQSVSVVAHTLNLAVRELIMRLYLSGKVGYYIYLKGLMFLVPILKHFNFPPCYRAIILITKQK